MENLAINRADIVKQALQDSLTHQLPWSLQLMQRTLVTYLELPTKFLKKLTLTRRSKRCQRSEAIERNALLLMAVVRYTDLATMQIGVPMDAGGFLGLSYRFIAKKIGWRTDEDDELDKKLISQGKRPKERGVKRVARAVKDLKAAGYLDVTPKSKMHDNGTYEGIAAIKRVSPSLFYDLGVSVKQLKECCERAKKRIMKKKEQYRLTLLRLVREGTESVKQKFKRKQKSPDDIVKRKAKQLELQRIREIPDNMHLSSHEFYLKYPSLKPDS